MSQGLKWACICLCVVVISGLAIHIFDSLRIEVPETAVREPRVQDFEVCFWDAFEEEPPEQEVYLTYEPEEPQEPQELLPRIVQLREH